MGSANFGTFWRQMAGPSSVFFQDDFLPFTPVSGNFFPNHWGKESIGAGSFNQVNNGWPRFGVAELTTGTSSTNGYVLYGSDNGSPGYYALEALSGNAGWDTTWIFKLSQTTLMRFRIGLSAGDPSTVPSANAVGLRFDTTLGDTGFNFFNRAAGSDTESTSNVATLDTNWHTLRMRSAVAGTVLFSMDGGTETPLAGMPTTSLRPVCQIVTATTAARVVQLDYWDFLAAGLTR